ncbi:hypothetical protein [Lentibacillus sp. Marseille-P4043]|nr:hypothetical protein [Lentibacillus sp. Marseille-P4043]
MEISWRVLAEGDSGARWKYRSERGNISLSAETSARMRKHRPEC